MSPEAFAYWLQGHVELNPTQDQPTPAQWKMIKEHLQQVFVKVTPPMQPHFVNPWTNPAEPPYRITCDFKTQTIC